MPDKPQLHTLDELLTASHATAEFKEAVRALARGERPERIDFNGGAPLVKVLRVVLKTLETFPERAIEKMTVQGTSGCSNFTGQATLEPGDLAIKFDWDCRWRAQQLAWHDFYGEPDQIRAAHELQYQCFRLFEAHQPAVQP